MLSRRVTEYVIYIFAHEQTRESDFRSDIYRSVISFQFGDRLAYVICI
jgi:hypothetical protein